MLNSGTLEFDAAGGAGTGSIAFAGSAELRLSCADNSVPTNTITNFVLGDAIEITGFLATGSSYAAGALTLDGTAGNATLVVPGLALSDFIITPDAADNLTTISAACYVADTRILPTEGEVPIQALRPGDHVITLIDGHPRPSPIVWVGHRVVDLVAHSDLRAVVPIRIRRGAFGANVPHCDLLISPDHAIFSDGLLIPAKLLVNGATIFPELGMATRQLLPCRTRSPRGSAGRGSGRGELSGHRQPSRICQRWQSRGAASGLVVAVVGS